MFLTITDRFISIIYYITKKIEESLFTHLWCDFLDISIYIYNLLQKF